MLTLKALQQPVACISATCSQVGAKCNLQVGPSCVERSFGKCKLVDVQLAFNLCICNDCRMYLGVVIIFYNITIQVKYDYCGNVTTNLHYNHRSSSSPFCKRLLRRGSPSILLSRLPRLFPFFGFVSGLGDLILKCLSSGPRIMRAPF